MMSIRCLCQIFYYAGGVRLNCIDLAAYNVDINEHILNRFFTVRFEMRHNDLSRAFIDR